MSAVTTVTKTKEAAIRPTFPIAHDRLTMDAADAASSLFSPTPHESGPVTLLRYQTAPLPPPQSMTAADPTPLLTTVGTMA